MEKSNDKSCYTLIDGKEKRIGIVKFIHMRFNLLCCLHLAVFKN